MNEGQHCPEDSAPAEAAHAESLVFLPAVRSDHTIQHVLLRNLIIGTMIGMTV